MLQKPSQGQKRECIHGYCGDGYGAAGYGSGNTIDTGYHGYNNGVNGDFGHEGRDCGDSIGCYNHNYGHGSNFNDGCHGENCHHDRGHHNHDHGFEVYEEWGEEKGHGGHLHEHGNIGNHHGYGLCADQEGQGYYGYAPCHGHEGFHGHNGEHAFHGHHHGFQHEWGHDEGAHAANNGEFAHRGNYFGRFGRSLSKIKSGFPASANSNKEENIRNNKAGKTQVSYGINYDKKWTTNGGAGFTEGYRNEYTFGRPADFVSGSGSRFRGPNGFLGGVDSYGIPGTHGLLPSQHNYNYGLGYGHGSRPHYGRKHGGFDQDYSPRFPSLYKYGYGYGLENDHIPFSNTHQINGGQHIGLPYIFGHKHHVENGQHIGLTNHNNLLHGTRFDDPRDNWDPVHNYSHSRGI